jgi:hypothetical protein
MANEDELSDTVFSDATSVLDLGWDAGRMAASGCLSIRDWHGVFFITSSDYDPAGPFASIGDALDHEYLWGPIPGLGLASDSIPLQQLLALGERLIGEDDDYLDINDRRYIRAKDGALVEMGFGG